MSSKNIKGYLLRFGAALLAVGLIGAISSQAPGAGQALHASPLALIGPAFAQDQGVGNANTGTTDNGGNAGGGNAGGNAGGTTDTGPSMAASGASPNATDVPVGINDILHVEVVGQSDLTNDYQVDNAGDITMPYVGRIHVAGTQTDQVAPIITKKLNTIYNDVTVIVTRRSIGGIAVTMTGALGKQGTVVVRRDARLNDVIQEAGPLSDADLGHVTITRGLPGNPKTTLNIDYNSFLGSNNPDGNPPLRDGDVIYVPHKTPVTISVSITGDVANPARYDLPAGSTFFDLVSRAGGLTPRADRNNIYIQPLATLNHTPVNYDQASENPENPTDNPILQDGDKVVVPELPNQPTFSITGGVINPGVKPLQGTVTLSDAIGDAQGVAPHAHLDQTQITRRTPNGAEVIKVDAKDPKVAGDFMVQPDDNIYIPPGSGPMQVNPFEVIGLLITAYAVFH